MSLPVIFFEYMYWHYGKGVREIMEMWGNLHWFLYHFFSVPVLLHTLFRPFKRIEEGYGRGFDPGRIFETFAANLISRFVGFLIRGVLLFLAAVAEFLLLGVGAIFFILFMGAPAVLLLSVILGVLFLVG